MQLKAALTEQLLLVYRLVKIIALDNIRANLINFVVVLISISDSISNTLIAVRSLCDVICWPFGRIK